MITLEQLHCMRGKRVLVTGASGHIGIKVVETFAELGAHVVLCDTNAEKLADTSRQINSIWRLCNIDSQVCDLECEASRIALAEHVKSNLGGIDAFVHCAGFVGTTSLEGWLGDLESQSLETWRRAFEVNLTSAFHLSQLFAKTLTESKGSITFFSSIYGTLGPDYSLYESTSMGNPAAYAASKGGLVQLTRWLSTTMAPHVRVNCISPGGVARNQDPAFVEKYETRTPLGRMACEDDFKGIVALLSTRAGSYITGQNIMVDGGWSTW